MTTTARMAMARTEVFWLKLFGGRARFDVSGPKDHHTIEEKTLERITRERESHGQGRRPPGARRAGPAYLARRRRALSRDPLGDRVSGVRPVRRRPARDARRSAPAPVDSPLVRELP